MMPSCGAADGFAPRAHRSRHRSIIIVVMGFVWLLQAARPSFDLASMPLVSAALIIAFGLPHGALDVMVAGMYRDLTDRRTLTFFLVQYVSVALCVALLWWLLPIVALVGFLVISAVHFGGDWDDAFGSIGQATIGVAMLASTSLMHQGEVVAIFSWLVPQTVAVTVGQVMYALAPFALFGAVLVLLRGMSRSPFAACEAAATIVSAIFLPPITFFIVYFCLLHSVRHLCVTRVALQRHSPRDLVREAAPYALLAALACLGVSVAFLHLGPGVALLSSVFVVLSALTVPHMLLVERHRP
jgi:Brp/Blh family beta-carotene 15,15'-monooxygenase